MSSELNLGTKISFLFESPKDKTLDPGFLKRQRRQMSHRKNLFAQKHNLDWNRSCEESDLQVIYELENSSFSEQNTVKADESEAHSSECSY